MSLHSTSRSAGGIRCGRGSSEERPPPSWRRPFVYRRRPAHGAVQGSSGAACAGRDSLLRPRSRSGEGRRGGWGGRLRRRLDRGGGRGGLRRRLGWGGRLGRRRRSRRRRGGRLARRRGGRPAGAWGRRLHRRARGHGGLWHCTRNRVGSDLRGAGRGIGGLLRGRDGGRPKDESPHGNGCRDASHRPSHPAEWSLRLQGCHPPRSADHTELRP